MGNNCQKYNMKKIVVLFLFALASTLSFAIPNGCYSGSSRQTRDRCAIQISGNDFNIINREGDVIARWKIISDTNGQMSLKSEYGATASASWWEEDGKIYLSWNYDTFSRM
jgi:hypothetical protein